jgi:hypothetical protein
MLWYKDEKLANETMQLADKKLNLKNARSN